MLVVGVDKMLHVVSFPSCKIILCVCVSWTCYSGVDISKHLYCCVFVSHVMYDLGYSI